MSRKLSVYIVTYPGAFPLVIDHVLTLKRTAPSYHNLASYPGKGPGYEANHNHVQVLYTHMSHACMHVAVRVLHSSAFIMMLSSTMIVFSLL